MLDRQALWNISYGLYVVSSVSGQKTNGQIVNSVIQVSADPPSIAVSINKNNLTHEYIQESGVLAVSVLEEETPMNLIGLFGFKSGRDVDKMSQVSCRDGQTGCPVVIDSSLCFFEGKVAGSVDCGTHTIFVAEVVGAQVIKEGTPLTYAYYRNVMKGKASKNAPTYKGDTGLQDKPEDKKMEGGMKKYVCNVCGYIYDPEVGDSEGNIEAGTSFEDLPDSWTCPVCGASKDEFSPEE
ncbi:MAG TPA: High molecular weight rubredoxin [Deltaproteobacteria bacterium]|nr:High molecular weight rubredoxin [Deltaproteobacteria bacterium]